ncbi:MAG: hypothetical protein JXR76_25660, partial [Deltaproteobacteria bacterium]|nr:hypothetical protein [Deltaproteobacteria bacterium]
VPPLAVAAFLWLLDRAEGVTAPRSGGTWRPMGDDDVTALKRILAAYRRRRFSALDASTPVGMITFGIAVCVLGMGVWKMHGLWPRVAFGSTVAGLIWKVPVWFSFFRRELPVDPGIESFYLLKRWKRGLSRLVGRISPDAEAQYWIREDELGPAEVRLRVNPAPLNLNELEIAAEVVQSQTAYKICKVAILKVSPGTMAARTLAACPNTVEHHLTPDLQQEIIVLRNRRGKRDWGFTHLRQALFAIQSH